MSGIFYNSKSSLCSIWESGKMCYNALKNSESYSLDYSEEQNFDYSYDFVIYNQHFTVNNWIDENMVKQFNKPVFCIVTEVSFSSNPIDRTPNYFSHYIVLDPTIVETEKIHGFGRPIEDFDLSTVNAENINYDIPKIFSFGFATEGKEWHKIVEQVQNEYDKAFIHFNIPKGDYVPIYIHENEVKNIYKMCRNILKKPEIFIKITSDVLSKEELINLCSTKTIICFFYNRQHIFSSGLSAVTDQAISSGRPLLVSSDCTFRHIHKYMPFYPNISIKEAIKENLSGVLQMKEEWSSKNFLIKFEKILTASL
jgi:hypothetical protein